LSDRISAEDAGAVFTKDRAIEAEEANTRMFEDLIRALQEAWRRDE
jgi:hypothetical protein